MFMPIDATPAAGLRPEGSGIAPGDWDILADFWYPVAIARDLGDSPMTAQLLDVDLVLYRGVDGDVAAALDLCPHRHVRLSGGRVIAGEIECPFHGLRFDTGGRCRRVPALGRDARLPDSYRVRTFPVTDRYGLLWTCLGDPARHAVPDFPSLNGCDPAGFGFSRPLVWPISSPRQVENFLDLAHLPLVHANTLGGDPFGMIRPARIDYTDDGFVSTTRYIETGREGQPVPVDFRYRVVVPFAVEFSTRKVAHPDEIMESCDIPSPVSAHRCKVFQIMKHAEGAAKAQAIVDMLAGVNDEDIETLKGLVSHDLPLDQHHEIHLPPDNVSAAYRKCLRGLGLGTPRGA